MLVAATQPTATNVDLLPSGPKAVAVAALSAARKTTFSCTHLSHTSFTHDIHTVHTTTTSAVPFHTVQYPAGDGAVIYMACELVPQLRATQDLWKCCPNLLCL